MSKNTEKKKTLSLNTSNSLAFFSFLLLSCTTSLNWGLSETRPLWISPTLGWGEDLASLDLTSWTICGLHNLLTVSNEILKSCAVQIAFSKWCNSKYWCRFIFFAAAPVLCEWSRGSIPLSKSHFYNKHEYRQHLFLTFGDGEMALLMFLLLKLDMSFIQLKQFKLC